VHPLVLLQLVEGREALAAGAGVVLGGLLPGVDTLVHGGVALDGEPLVAERARLLLPGVHPLVRPQAAGARESLAVVLSDVFLGGLLPGVETLAPGALDVSLNRVSQNGHGSGLTPVWTHWCTSSFWGAENHLPQKTKKTQTCLLVLAAGALLLHAAGSDEKGTSLPSIKSAEPSLA